MQGITYYIKEPRAIGRSILRYGSSLLPDKLYVKWMYYMQTGKQVNTTYQRKPWIDALRALAIIMVVLGHQVKGEYIYFLFTSPVKMPLFFAISGYVFNLREGNSCLFWKNWFYRIIIPWFGLALIVFLPNIVSVSILLRYLYNLISGKMLWFMPCFAIAEIIFFYIQKYAKKEVAIILCTLSCTLLGFLANANNILNFGMINRAFVVQSFFLIGYLFKQHQDKFSKIEWKHILFLFILYLGSCWAAKILFLSGRIDVHTNYYFNIPFAFYLIFLGVFVLFIAASKSDFSSQLMSIIGKNTLIIYIWHKYIINLLVYAMSMFHYTIANLWLFAAIKTIWAVAIAVLCGVFLNRYIPELVGKKRHAQSSKFK